METLDSVFKATAARQWNGHKKNIPSWKACQNFLRLRFMDQPQEVKSRFDGKNSPQEHLAKCYEVWQHVPQEEWVHRFVHTLDLIARNQYAEAELRQDTVSWDCLVDSFVLIFSTNEVCPALDVAIRLIHTKVFDD